MKKSLPYLYVCLKSSKNKDLVYSIVNSHFFVLKAILEIAHNILKENVEVSPINKRSLLPFKKELLCMLTGPWSKKKLPLLFKEHQGRQLLKTLLIIGIPFARLLASYGSENNRHQWA